MPTMGDRLRVGVVGCGLIAQVKHLPILSELHDRYEVAAVCDLSPEVVDACRRRHQVPQGSPAGRTCWSSHSTRCGC
jgi:predicted dehydrogenase